MLLVAKIENKYISHKLLFKYFKKNREFYKNAFKLIKTIIPYSIN